MRGTNEWGKYYETGYLLKKGDRKSPHLAPYTAARDGKHHIGLRLYR